MTGKRGKLCDIYISEREEICTRILNILQLDEHHTFLLCNFEEDLEKQTSILDMRDEIQKYFACSSISSFKSNFECKRPALNIVRGILRKQGFTFISSDIVVKLENGKTRATKKYHVFREIS